MQDIPNIKEFKLIIGLGNPGEDYENTYHNAGFLALEQLAKNQNFKKYRNFEYLKIENLTLVRPLTFMNESGAAVKEALKFFSVKPEEILVIHDDSDLEVGKFKFGFSRSAGGHRGILSIIEVLRTKDFWRLRLGIRKNHPEKPRVKALDFVLKKMTKSDREAISYLINSLILNVKLKETPPLGKEEISEKGKFTS